MTEIRITHVIEASPTLTEAIKALADALAGRQTAPVTAEMSTPTVAEKPVETAVEAPVTVVNPTPVPAVSPVAPTPIPEPAVPTVEAPTPAPAPVVPAEKVYTFADISAAGSALLEQNKMPQLMALLGQFGVQAVTQLKPEQYPGVAAGLRDLGANI